MGKFLNRNQRHNFFDDNTDNSTNAFNTGSSNFSAEPPQNNSPFQDDSFSPSSQNELEQNSSFNNLNSSDAFTSNNNSFSNDNNITFNAEENNADNVTEDTANSEPVTENENTAVAENNTDIEISDNISNNSLDTENEVENNSDGAEDIEVTETIVDTNSGNFYIKTTSTEVQNVDNETDIMKTLNIEDICILPNNPFVTKDKSGNDIDDIVSLANDIKENGLIHPITVTLNKDNKYELVSGERRLKALKFLNRTEVPAFIRKFKSEEDKNLAVFAANLATRQYSPLTKINLIAEYYKHLLLANTNDVNASANARKKISDLLHISTAQIQKYISIVKKLKNVPDDILADYDEGNISFTDLYKYVSNGTVPKDKSEKAKEKEVAKGQNNISNTSHIDTSEETTSTEVQTVDNETNNQYEDTTTEQEFSDNVSSNSLDNEDNYSFDTSEHIEETEKTNDNLPEENSAEPYPKYSNETDNEVENALDDNAEDNQEQSVEYTESTNDDSEDNDEVVIEENKETEEDLTSEPFNKYDNVNNPNISDMQKAVIPFYGRLCSANKVSNSAAKLRGYPIVINDECYLVLENVVTNCVDESKDKYNVNLFKVDVKSLQIV